MSELRVPPPPASLTREAMLRAMDRMIDGSMPAEEIATLLRTMAQRGESAVELAAGVESLRRRVVALPVDPTLKLCDTCGTGGDRHQTFNISTLAALVAAACGVRIAKHGNRAASSRCGSADVLETLGLNLDASPERIAASIRDVGFGFCFAPRFHPAMKAVAPIRKQMGIRTIFNIIGPLANPARITSQLVGVAEAHLLQPIAETLVALRVRHALVVHGLDGLDEVTITGATKALEVRNGEITRLTIAPEQLKVPRASLDALRGGDPAENARIAREILGGAASPKSDMTAVNAACAIYVADRAASIADGLAMAQAALREGRPLALLERVVAASRA